MALSKTYIRPVKPNNISDYTFEGESDHANLAAPNNVAFTPGTLVVKDASGNFVRANDLDILEQVYIIWTDGSRADATKTKLDGTEVTRYTTLMPSGLICDVASTLFTAVPNRGEYLVLADNGTDADHGKLTPVTSGELATLISNLSLETAIGLVVGRVTELASRTYGGVTFNRVRFE